MRKRLMVTGAGGFVAGSIIQDAVNGWEVHGVSRSPAPVEMSNLVWHQLPEVDADCLHDVFHDIEPDALIHTAALADIDFCEANKELAEQVNTTLTRELAELCEDHDTRVVFLSTDTVFDGERGLYTEDDPPHPVNFYGTTKVRAEEAVASVGGNAVIARVALVMGLPVLGAGNSFVSRMIATLEAGKNATAPSNEVRSPVDVFTLGRALVELAGNDFLGRIHLSGNDVLNRYDMMLRIAARLGYAPDRIIAQDPSGIPGRAPRPRDVSLSNAKARAVLQTPMAGLDEGLELVLASRK
ncbi:MAG: NAD(P)-dependent oxidoreductase [Candidatus Hydrogenedentes bacterium]|nr:NAD(P)-dependent oxidoreductase [Candidatus Hydrogenedentota bacterium]